MLRLDHVSLAVNDLSKVDGILSLVGLVHEPPITPFPGSRGHIYRFASGFLEVIAPGDAGDLQATPLGQGYTSFLSQSEGIFAVALATDDMDADAHRLRSAGLDVRGPVQQSISLPSGRSLSFRSAAAGFERPWLAEYEEGGDEAPPGGRARGRPGGRPAGEVDLHAVGIITSDLESTVSEYRRAYGVEAGQLREDELLGCSWVALVLPNGGEIRLMSPVNEILASFLGTRQTGYAYVSLSVPAGTGGHLSREGFPVFVSDSRRTFIGTREGWLIGLEEQ